MDRSSLSNGDAAWLLSPAWLHRTGGLYLVPDYEERMVSGHCGRITDTDYAMAARARDGSTITAYLPEGGTVAEDMSKISGGSAS